MTATPFLSIQSTVQDTPELRSLNDKIQQAVTQAMPRMWWHTLLLAGLPLAGALLFSQVIPALISLAASALSYQLAPFTYQAFEFSSRLAGALFGFFWAKGLWEINVLDMIYRSLNTVRRELAATQAPAVLLDQMDSICVAFINAAKGYAPTSGNLWMDLADVESGVAERIVPLVLLVMLAVGLVLLVGQLFSSTAFWAVAGACTGGWVLMTQIERDTPETLARLAASRRSKSPRPLDVTVTLAPSRLQAPYLRGSLMAALSMCLLILGFAADNELYAGRTLAALNAVPDTPGVLSAADIAARAQPLLAQQMTPQGQTWALYKTLKRVNSGASYGPCAAFTSRYAVCSSRSGIDAAFTRLGKTQPAALADYLWVHQHTPATGNNSIDTLNVSTTDVVLFIMFGVGALALVLLAVYAPTWASSDAAENASDSTDDDSEETDTVLDRTTPVDGID